MSHFSVGIITKGKPTEDKLATILAPYQENNMDDCPRQFLKFHNVYNECKESYKKESKEIKSKYPTLKDYITNYCEYHLDETKHKYGYWSNPNAKWDWYQIGGRYGKLETPIKVKDIPLINEDEKQKLTAEWELFVDKRPPQTEEEKETVKWQLYNANYYIDKYKTKENYAELESQFSTYAVITKDGKWHEPGTMGWFGCSSATNEEEVQFIKDYKKLVFNNAQDDDYLTIVDCHI